MSAADSSVTPAQPFELASRQIRRPVVVAADGGLAAHMVDTPDPVLAAHQLLADLAVLYNDHPGRQRAVVAMPPRSWRPDEAFLTTALDGMASSPVVAPMTVDDVFGTIPIATTGGGGPAERQLVTGPSPVPVPTSPVRQDRRQGRTRGPLRTWVVGKPHGSGQRSYFCSELVCEACVVAGLLDPETTRPSATYPRDLFYGRSFNPFIDRNLDLNCGWYPPARWTDCP